MATKSSSYDSPKYQARLVCSVYVPAVAASTSALKFPAFMAMTVKRVGAIVKTAGTNTAAGWDIRNGTTSVGDITAGTNAANTVLTAFQSDVSLSSGGWLDIVTKANSATLQGDFCIELELTPGAEYAA